MYYEGSRHYNPILNIKAAAGSRGGYCVACNVGFRKTEVIDIEKNAHDATSCECPDVELIKCDSCVRVFFGHTYFERHRAQGSYNQSLASVCESIKICNGCGRLINPKSRRLRRNLLQNSPIVAVFELFVRPLCHKASVENLGEKKNCKQIRMTSKTWSSVLKETASHSCFMISKRDKTRCSKERRT